MLELDKAAAFFGGLMGAFRRGRLETTGAVETNGGQTIDGGLMLLESRGDRLSGSVMECAA